jgi:hypothetical protein
MRVVIIVPPLTQTSLLERPAKPLFSLNYGIEPHRSKLPLECPQFEEAPTLRERASQLRQNANLRSDSARREPRANCRKTKPSSGRDHAAGVRIPSISLRE